MPILPGDMKDRMVELRNQRGLTQEALSKELEEAGLGYFDRSTISRAEKGGTQKVSSELLMALSSYYQVSVDFLCGLTDDPGKKDYELKELGLSYNAAKKLLSGEVDPDAINRLMECENFPLLSYMIAEYFPSDRAEVYEEISGYTQMIRDLPNCAGDLGYDLTEAQKRKMKVWTDRFPDPVKEQKDAVKDQFSLVADDLTAYIDGDKKDPQATDLTNGQVLRLLKQEAMRIKHTSNIRMFTKDETIDLITGLAARRMDLYPEEEDLLNRLYRMMFQNRYEDKRLQKAQ